MLVIQLCLTLYNPMDCSPPCSSVHGKRKNTGAGCHSLLQGVFLTQGLNLGLPHCRQILYHLSHQGSPYRNMQAAFSCSAATGKTLIFLSRRTVELIMQILTMNEYQKNELHIYIDLETCSDVTKEEWGNNLRVKYRL